jgi:CRISPR-associated exonuclease Cas4
MVNEDDYEPIRALNDLLFCPRRCALHRLEGIWVENAHTQAGTFDHRRVHEKRDNEESPYRTARGLRIVSHRFRIVGVTDLVEFRPTTNDITGEQPLLFPGATEVPYPVEYKRGRRRKWDNDEVQLCAQAFCLEEMLRLPVPYGAIFHVKSRRRREVEFDPSLRRRTIDTIARLHELLATSVTPPPVLHPKCKQCSLYHLCLPELIASPKGYRRAAAELFSI